MSTKESVPKDPVPNQVDPEEPTVFEAEPDLEPEEDDPNTYPDENSVIGGGPLYRPTGP